MMTFLHNRTALLGLAGALAVGLVAATPGNVRAADSVADIVNYKGADRQTMLEAGAKKEGKILVYATASQTQPIYAAVAKKYPFLKVDIFNITTVDLTRRVIEEQKAGRLSVDAVECDIAGLKVMRDIDILAPFSAPDMKYVNKDAIERDNKWVILHQSHNELAWNTKAYQEKDVPKTFDDLLDPKWKGKFAISTRGSTLRHWIGVMVLEKGEDFVRKLRGQDFTAYSIGGRGLSNLVVSGEVPISPTIYSTHMRSSLKKGASVAWHDLGAVFANELAMGIPKTSSSPHAAMLLFDFMISQEGQKMRQKLGYVSTRPDLFDPGRQMPQKIYHLPERPNYPQEYKQWDQLAKEVFGKGTTPPKKK